jgi:hypothetical protein
MIFEASLDQFGLSRIINLIAQSLTFDANRLGFEADQAYDYGRVEPIHYQGQVAGL